MQTQTQPTQSTPPESPRPPRRSARSWLTAIFDNWFVSWIVLPIGLVLILHFYVFSAFHVVGTSMLPTLQNSDYLIVSKVERTKALIQGKPYIPKRGQIIVFKYPKQPDLDFVKRVIALPGERIIISNCNVTIYNAAHPNGFNPDATHSILGSCTELEAMGPVDETIPTGTVFVLGDNRTPAGSSDSRDWGLLPSTDIIGNAVVRLFPVNSIKTF